MRIPDVLSEITQLLCPVICGLWDFHAPPHRVEVVIHETKVIGCKVDESGHGFHDEAFETAIAGELTDVFPKIRFAVEQSELLSSRKHRLVVKAEIITGGLSLTAEASMRDGLVSIQTLSMVPFLTPIIVEGQTILTLAVDLDRTEAAHLLEHQKSNAVAFCVANGKLAGEPADGRDVLAWEFDCREHYDHPSKNWKSVEFVNTTFLVFTSKTFLDREAA